MEEVLLDILKRRRHSNGGTSTTAEKNNKANKQEDITMEEFRYSIQKIRYGKVPGPNVISVETIKSLGKLGCRVLINLLNHKDWQLRSYAKFKTKDTAYNASITEEYL